VTVASCYGPPFKFPSPSAGLKPNKLSPSYHVCTARPGGRDLHVEGPKLNLTRSSLRPLALASHRGECQRGPGRRGCSSLLCELSGTFKLLFKLSHPIFPSTPTTRSDHRQWPRVGEVFKFWPPLGLQPPVSVGGSSSANSALRFSSMDSRKVPAQTCPGTCIFRPGQFFFGRVATATL
jgi:hypothetical protein